MKKKKLKRLVHELVEDELAKIDQMRVLSREETSTAGVVGRRESKRDATQPLVMPATQQGQHPVFDGRSGA